MQTLSDIKALLAQAGLAPRHRYGQNFLHDQRKLARIVVAAELSVDDLVLEVGPGTGALTEALLEAGARVLAVEIDTSLRSVLEPRLSRWPGRVRVLFADVLAGKHQVNPDVFTVLRDLAGGGAGGGGGGVPAFVLVANLPYNVASPLIVNLAVDQPALRRAVVMVQREVAGRLTAAPGGKDFGPLTVMVQVLMHVERITTLPPGCFWPPPRVDSAVVRLIRRDVPLTRDPRCLSALMQRLFGRRRKQLGTILGRSVPLPTGVDARQRPEQLSIEQLVALSEFLPAEVSQVRHHRLPASS